ncbi:MAG: acyl-CoA thioester hydrolase/BAAT C-terminal domain-containing protein [Bacteroidia bacterium]|nr:acyl-CoA thioester hydrolase/BAAT C-terminal domain-containing protein [Bacteroidia bacterium]
MKKLGKFLLSVVMVLLVVGLAIFGLRMFNGQRFSEYEQAEGTPEHYVDVRNMDVYPTEAEGVSITKVQDGSTQGFHMVPDDPQHDGIVITYGGSEGSPGYDVALNLAQQGYETLALFFFGQDNQENMLIEVPIDQFEETLSWVESNAENADIITLYGASKGAEYAANVASRFDEVDNVILMAPASHNYQGLGQTEGSTWTYEGAELPYLSFRDADPWPYISETVWPMISYAPITYNSTYEPLLNNASNRDEARIPIEDSAAEVLIFAGGDDQMWPSKQMGELIVEAKPDAELHVYEDAGHLFRGKGVLGAGGMLLNMGGSEEANAEASALMNEVVLEKLEEWH